MVRPCKQLPPSYRLVTLALYQKQMRRTLKGLIQSLQQMLDIFLFFFIIILIYSFIGARVIGDLGGDETVDPVMKLESHNFQAC